jgi:DNA transformation protein
MAEPSSVMQFARDLFAGLGPVAARRMFGAVGLFVDGAMFGLIDDGAIYLKTDATLKAALAEAGSRAWTHELRKGPKAGKAQETSYWSLPETASDDPDEACAWARRALAVARARKGAE